MFYYMILLNFLFNFSSNVLVVIYCHLMGFKHNIFTIKDNINRLVD